MRNTPRRRSSTTRKFAPKELQAVRAEGDEILTNTVVIHFFPNSWDPFKKVSKTVDGKTVEERYDPNVKNVLEEIAQLAGQFGTARIIIEGHTDSSMKGQVPVEAVKELSPEAGQRHQGSSAQEVHRSRSQSIQRRRRGLGSSGRPDRSAQPDQEPPRRDQGAHRREGDTEPGSGTSDQVA